jgi:hypothetical protein
VDDPDAGAHVLKLDVPERLGENVRELIFSLDILNPHLSLLDAFTDVVELYLNVLVHVVEN